MIFGLKLLIANKGLSSALSFLNYDKQFSIIKPILVYINNKIIYLLKIY